MSSQPAPLLRPLGIADFLDVAIRLYRQNFSVFLGITAIVYAPLLVTQMVMGFFLGDMMNGTMKTPSSEPPWEQMGGMGIAWAGMLLLYAVVVPLGQGALAVAVSRRYLGRSASVAEAYRAVGVRWLRILGALLLVGLSLMLASTLIIGGVIAAIALIAEKASEIVAILSGVGLGFAGLVLLAGVMYAWLLCDFTTPAIVIEDIGAIEAIGRSISLVRGYWWHCFGVLLVMGLVVGIASSALAYPVSMLAAGLLATKSMALAQAISQGVSVGVRMLVEPVMITGFVLLYYDLRVRKEGFDLELLAQAMGYQAPAPLPAVPLPPKADEPAVPLPPIVQPAGVALPPVVTEASPPEDPAAVAQPSSATNPWTATLAEPAAETLPDTATWPDPAAPPAAPPPAATALPPPPNPWAPSPAADDDAGTTSDNPQP